MRRPLGASGRVVCAGALLVGGCAGDLDAWPMSNDPLDVEPLAWTASAFTADPALDRDGDCMDDAAEHALAQHFRPMFVFDSRESARRPIEPAVLYQVHPERAEGACERPPEQVEVTWAYLLADDGGYTSSTFCSDRHPGDNQYVRATVRVSESGARFELVRLVNWRFTWPGTAVRLIDRSHPTIFLSAGKHHPFFDTIGDGRRSPYSNWGCVEAVNGGGARVLSALESPRVARGRHNVGERARHPADAFVDYLGVVGFVGERAWGEEPFCGGRPRNGCTRATNAMQAVWR